MPPKKKTTTMKRRRPPPKVNIRNNGGSASAKADKNGDGGDKKRREFGERMRGMSGTHALAGAAAGTIGNALSVALVGLGWVSPKATAGILMGTGAATTAAGYYWDADHAMFAGAGLTAAGTWSLAQQYAVDAYEAIEKRVEDKKGKEAEGDQQLAAASEEARNPEPSKQRNAGPRLVIVRDDHDPDSEYSYDN